MASSNAIETFELRKVFGEKIAVQGLTMRAARGEVFGFLGPNGAGKTTSIKMLLGLVRPTSGTALLLGEPITHVGTRRRVGFLPEHFRFHEWLRAGEFLDLHGQLYGMSQRDRQRRGGELLDKVGLNDVANKPLGAFSKGMQQRLGLAMALLNRPEVVFLDEPTSGLDPFGRLLVRDVIKDARAEGTTVFLNSHLLGEVEATCDRVAFIRQGRVLKAGTLAELSAGQVEVHLKLGEISTELLMELAHWGGDAAQQSEHDVVVRLQGEDQIPELNAWLVGQGVKVFALNPRQSSLEDLFLSIMGGATADELKA